MKGKFDRRKIAQNFIRRSTEAGFRGCFAVKSHEKPVVEPYFIKVNMTLVCNFTARGLGPWSCFPVKFLGFLQNIYGRLTSGKILENSCSESSFNLFN